MSALEAVCGQVAKPCSDIICGGGRDATAKESALKDLRQRMESDLLKMQTRLELSASEHEATVKDLQKMQQR